MVAAARAVAEAGPGAAPPPLALIRPARPQVRTAVAVYAAAVLLAAVGLVHVGVFYHDDGFISLRYAARLLAGDGLTWNPAERVEGFTHPLWLAQIATLGALGIDLPSASRALGLLYLAAIFAVWRVARAEPILLLMVATQGGLLLWSVSGLETTGFAFWLALGAWLTQEALWADEAPDRSARWRAALAGAALGAAGMTRPEGIGAGVVALLLLAASRRWRPLLAAGLTFGVLVGSYELFRIAYFGDVLPNTAYAKLGGLPMSSRVSAGIAYLAATQEAWLPSVVIAAAACALGRGRRPLAMVLIASPVLANVLMAGGDHMPAARLLVPLLVTLLLAGAIAAREGLRHRGLVTALVAVVAAAQLVALLVTPVECDPAAVTGEHVGRFLEANLPAGATVATATAGSTPYHAPSIRFIDTLGLNDRHIARREIRQLTTRWQHTPGHLKGDGAYVLGRAPDVIILGPAQGFLGQRPTDWFLTDFELLQSPEFAARYRPYRFIVAIPPESIERRPLPLRVDRNPQVRFILYLRTDSSAVDGLMQRGTPLRRPAAA
jgi:hypothetical protein